MRLRLVAVAWFAILGCIERADPPVDVVEIDVGVDIGSLADVEAQDLDRRDLAPDEPRADGAPCGVDVDCIGGTCKTGDGFPDGYCANDACDGGCVDGSACSYSLEFGIFCAATCETQDDCRDGYACRGEGVGGVYRVCAPIRGVPDGESCGEAADCQGGICLAWPGGYCTTNRCSVDTDCASIGDFDNVCVDDGAAGSCLRRCSAVSDCRPGYLCTGFGSGPTFCIEDPARPFDDAVFADTTLDIQCGIPVVNGNATIDYEIGPTTTSYMITPMARDGQPLRPRRITLPDQTAKDFTQEREFLTYSAVMLRSMSPTLVPHGPNFTDMLASGPHTFTVGAEGGEICYYLLEKEQPGTTLDLNVYLIGIPNVTALSAGSDPNFAAVFGEVRRIYQQAGVTLLNVRYVDVAGADVARFGVLRNEGDIGEIVRLSEPPGPDLESRLSANVFFVGQFAVAGVLGYSTAQPGPAGLHGTHGSGVVFTAEYMGGPSEDTFGEPVDGNEYTALILAHEVGHWLGLLHTTWEGGQIHDQLADTAECANPIDAEACPDWGNLMFPYAGGGNSALTADQGFVLGANPAIR